MIRQLRERPPEFSIDLGHPLAQGLVFAGLGREYGSTFYRDSSPYKNHGTLTNMDPATDWFWDATLRRWVMDFDGADDRIPLPTDAIGTNDVTVSFWAKFRGWGGGYIGRIADNGPLYVITRSATQTFSIISGSGGDYVTSEVVALNTLYHAAITLKGNQAQWYVDGKVSGTSGNSGTRVAGTYPLNIGNRASDSARGFNGFLGDLLVHNRILSLSEIQQLADPGNAMLSGLILPPQRRVFAVGHRVPRAAYRRVLASAYGVSQ